jgi:hypothetical protein
VSISKAQLWATRAAAQGSEKGKKMLQKMKSKEGRQSIAEIQEQLRTLTVEGMSASGECLCTKPSMSPPNSGVLLLVIGCKVEVWK